ncbi:MAG: methyltransferase [Chlamydiia bacterium]|nr:methyltransferase [Chlamydiia bacterium]
MWKLYDKIAYWFDENRSKELMEQEYLELTLKHVPKNGAVLDLGCGTGEPLAKYFIDQGFQVTGVDGSSEMIQLCQKRFPEMEWIVGDMREVSLDKKFDVVLAWDSFFHLQQDDQRAMFKVFSSHIKNGGVLVFTSGFKQAEVYSNMNGYNMYHASLDTDEYKKLLQDFGFTILLHKVEDPNCGMHTVWVAQKQK